MIKKPLTAEGAKNKIAKLLARSVDPYYLFVNIADAAGLDMRSINLLDQPARPTNDGTDPEALRDTPEKLEYIARALVNAISEKGLFQKLDSALKRYED